jgi:hypothetical protein
VETPVIPAWDNLQGQNTILSTTGRGRNKYNLQAYTTDKTDVDAISQLFKDATLANLTVYVQNTLQVNANVVITSFSYSVSVGDIPRGDCKYNMTIEAVSA